MPVIKSAKKKLRQDKKRTTRNHGVEETLRRALKNAKKEPTTELVRLATKAADKAVKNHLIHANKAGRIKSALSKLLSGKTTEKKPATKAAKPVTKTAPKKKTVKK